jgi:hypothetical protein
VKILFAVALVAAQASVLAAANATVPLVKPMRTVAAEPVFLKLPKGDGGLTLYNARGEIVARCDRKGDSLSNCKLETGFTLDDVMTAWVRAYQNNEK